MKYYGSGVSNASYYLVAGQPYVTASSLPVSDTATGPAGGPLEHHIKFPFITKKFTVVVTGSETITVSFAPTGGTNVLANRNYVRITGLTGSLTASNVVAQSTYTFDCKCSEVFLSIPAGGDSGYVVFAELTKISAGEMYDLSGSGLDY